MMQLLDMKQTKIDVNILESIKRFLGRLSGYKNERRENKYKSRLKNVYSKLTKKT